MLTKEVIIMLPLTYGQRDEINVIRKVSGNPAIRKHLEDMGFVTGAPVKIISTIGGNLIVSVKDTKVALDRQLASRIMI